MLITQYLTGRIDTDKVKLLSHGTTTHTHAHTHAHTHTHPYSIIFYPKILRWIQSMYA